MIDFFDDEDAGEDAGEDFPASSAHVWCPYCGAEVELLLDPGGGPVQSYVEDCEVCCRPWYLTVRWDASGSAWVEARSEEE